jgi:hypothetical protein
MSIQIRFRANLLIQAEDHTLQLVHQSLKDYLLRIQSCRLLGFTPWLCMCLSQVAGFVSQAKSLTNVLDYALLPALLISIALMIGKDTASYTNLIYTLSGISWIARYRLSPSPSQQLMKAGERLLALYPFGIRVEAVHTNLLEECLAFMSHNLKMNGCHLLPGTLNNEIDEDDVQEYLCSIVQYACCHWVDHLRNSNTKGNRYGAARSLFRRLHSHLTERLVQFCADDSVHLFLQEKYLLWLEAMSLMRKLPEATDMMLELQRLTSVSISCMELY